MPPTPEPQTWRWGAGLAYGLLDVALGIAGVHLLLDWRVDARGLGRIWGLVPGDLALLLSAACLLLIPVHIWMQRRPPLPGLVRPQVVRRVAGIAVVLLILALYYAYRCQYAWAHP